MTARRFPLGKNCIVDGCDRNSHAKGMCKSHYGNFLKTGKVPTVPIGTMKARREAGCGVDGCNSPHFSKGFCVMHYSRLRATGDPVGKKKYSRPSKPHYNCTVDGCEGMGRTRGLCNAHYQRFLRLGDPLAGGIRRFKHPPECSIEGCEGSVVARGYCSAHYGKFQKYGDALYVSEWAKKRNVAILKNGYSYVYARKHPMAHDSRVLEHRLVMSEYLGRPLFENENVHHKDGDKTNNRIGNLELWVVVQPKGQRPIDLIAFAREILQRYEQDEEKFSGMYREEIKPKLKLVVSQ